MNDKDLCKLALTIAEEAHAGQVDKGGSPYVNHCRRVAQRFPIGETKAAALLHDVVEDCPGFTLERLADLGIPRSVCDTVDALTKRAGEDYDLYLQRVAEDDDAHRIKIMDLIDNMDASRLGEVTDKDKARIHHYARALGGLVVALDYKHCIEKQEIYQAKVQRVLFGELEEREVEKPASKEKLN